MVVRTWRGYAALGEAEAYPRHLLRTVRPKLRQISGFRGLYLLRQTHVEEIEYLVITLWESMDAIIAFAGDQPEQAVIEPEARAALIRFEEQVQHYDVLAAPDAG